MHSAIETLAGNLAFSRRLILDAVVDLSPEELGRSPWRRVRSAARLLGMVTLADRDSLVILGVEDLPEVPLGFEAQFARWGSHDDEEVREYDELLPELFALHRAALMLATEAMEPSRLDEQLDPPDHLDEEGLFRFETVGELILAVSSLTSFLAGELSLARLALGKLPTQTVLDRAIGEVGRETTRKADRKNRSLEVDG